MKQLLGCGGGAEGRYHMIWQSCTRLPAAATELTATRWLLPFLLAASHQQQDNRHTDCTDMLRASMQPSAWLSTSELVRGTDRFWAHARQQTWLQALLACCSFLLMKIGYVLALLFSSL